MNNEVESFSNKLSEFLLLLTQKERVVIERRFNLDDKERSTLEEIGQKFSVTRERVRQIEKNALSKLRRNLENSSLFDISNLAYKILLEAGGVITEGLLISKILSELHTVNSELIQLVLSIDKRLKRIPNKVAFHPYVLLDEYNHIQMEEICNLVVKQLQKSKNCLKISEIFELISAKSGKIGLNTFASLVQIDKNIKLVNNDFIGLFAWRDINPRTLRDKIYFVLRENRKAMHFVEISNKIIENNFDKKKINLQAVHNELIRHDDFILVGRGIYGLSEWGFKKGTVADVIESLLKSNNSMSQEKIIDEVLKQRQVKPITILLSLKNKSKFVRVGRKQYTLANSKA